MLNGFKKITALLMAVLMLLAALPAGAQGTEQYSNQVQPGISLTSILPSETPVVTYVFYVNDEVVSTQSVKNGDTLVEPEVTTGSNQKLTGWDPVVTFGTVSGITKTQTITVNAVIENVYHVFFVDDEGRVVATKEGKSGETISDFDEVTNAASTSIPLEADEGITGWKNENGTVVDFVTLANTDVTLTAVIEKGYWISFDSNEGSYVAPLFFKAGVSASAPSAPTKPGFTFDQWCTDESLTTKANFESIKTNITLYAKWNATQVSYTVIYWWENANDTDYSYYESQTLYGNAGESTNAVAKEYEGFSSNDIQQIIINGDGSTVVNVYYKRQKYQVKFFLLTCKSKQHNDIREHNDNCYALNNALTIDEKYGAYIGDKWPTYNNSSAWRTEPNMSITQASIDTMPLNGAMFYGPKTEGTVRTAYYYLEVLDQSTDSLEEDGKYYFLDHEDKTPTKIETSGQGAGIDKLYITDDDCYAITGFTYNKYIADSYEDKGETKYHYHNAKFFYTRNSYDVVYLVPGTIENTEVKKISYKYQANISSAAYYSPTTTPTGKEDYVFAGWYADPTCTVKYEFDGKTMPANNIVVYAKWIPPVYTVTVYDSDKTTVLKTFENIPKGDTISEADMPQDSVTVPEGGEFLGWVDMETEKPFHFDTQITKNYTLYAKVGSKDGYTVAYDTNGGSGTAPTDSATYAVGSSAVVQGKGDMVAPTVPEKGYFLGWAKTANAIEADYLPGASMKIVAADAVNGVITLYAVWGPKPATTTLIYNANYTGANPLTVTHKENGSEVLPNNATVTLYGAGTFTRQGYTLVGWSKTAGENATTDFGLGDQAIVDNIDLHESTNVLYAVWEKTTVTLTIQKEVEGITTTDSFTFNVSYTESDAQTTTSLASFDLQHNGTKVLTVPVGATLTIVETGAGNYTTKATYGSGSFTATEGTDGSRTITGITVGETDETITVTNTIKTGTLTIKKLVTGGWGDKTKIFNFTYKIGSSDAVSFTLSNNGTVTPLENKLPVQFPYGTKVAITEADYSGEGYTTSYQVYNGTETESSSATVTPTVSCTATVTIGAPSTTVTFTNHKDATIDTGVLLDSLPYVLILAGIAIIGVAVFVRKRRSRDDD